jgi:hypothetical protein
MARDLIPPPSPAGRPAPNPVLEPRTGAADEPPDPTPADTPEPPQPSPYRARFGFVFGALAGVALCAAALAVALGSTTSDDDPRLAPNWSAWKPGSTDMLAGAQDIAQHVGPTYKRDDGDQLVGVQSGELAYQGVPMGVAVQPQGGEIELLDGDGIMYVLNGLGENGALTGTPTKARGRLLRREALELVMYSFRYLPDATMVAVLLPPVKQEGAKAGDAPKLQAMLFRPGDLLPQLQVPLGETLKAKAPRPSTMTAQESTRVDSLTLSNLFIAQFQRAADGNPYLVLTEPTGIN